MVHPTTLNYAFCKPFGLKNRKKSWHLGTFDFLENTVTLTWSTTLSVPLTFQNAIFLFARSCLRILMWLSKVTFGTFAKLLSVKDYHWIGSLLHCFWIGDRKDSVCLPLHGHNSSRPYAAIPAMLESKGRVFFFIQVLYINALENTALLQNSLIWQHFPTPSIQML